MGRTSDAKPEANVLSIADIRAKLQTERGERLGPDPARITGLLIDAGYSPNTASNAAEVYCSVYKTIQTGKLCPPRWGWAKA